MHENTGTIVSRKQCYMIEARKPDQNKLGDNNNSMITCYVQPRGDI